MSDGDSCVSAGSAGSAVRHAGRILGAIDDGESEVLALGDGPGGRCASGRSPAPAPRSAAVR